MVTPIKAGDNITIPIEHPLLMAPRCECGSYTMVVNNGPEGVNITDPFTNVKCWDCKATYKHQRGTHVMIKSSDPWEKHNGNKNV